MAREETPSACETLDTPLERRVARGDIPGARDDLGAEGGRGFLGVTMGETAGEEDAGSGEAVGVFRAGGSSVGRGFGDVASVTAAEDAEVVEGGLGEWLGFSGDTLVSTAFPTVSGAFFTGETLLALL